MRSEIFRNRLILLYFGRSILFVALIAAPAAASDDLLIRNVILVSPERDEPVHNIDVLIQDGYIREIAENIESKLEVRVLEASGLYLTPALIDTRVNDCPVLLVFRKRVVYSSYTSLINETCHGKS